MAEWIPLPARCPVTACADATGRSPTVAHPDEWRDGRLMLDLRACPGKRALILGNHEHK